MRSIRRRHYRKDRRRDAQKLFSPGLRGPLLFLLLGISLPLVIRFVGHEFIHKRSFPLHAAEWKVHRLGQSHLSLLLPSEPRRADTPGPVSDDLLAQPERYRWRLKSSG